MPRRTRHSNNSIYQCGPLVLRDCSARTWWRSYRQRIQEPALNPGFLIPKPFHGPAGPLLIGITAMGKTPWKLWHWGNVNIWEIISVFLSCLAPLYFAVDLTRSHVWESDSWSLWLIVSSSLCFSGLAGTGEWGGGGTPHFAHHCTSCSPLIDSQILPKSGLLARRLRRPLPKLCSRRLKLWFRFPLCLGESWQEEHEFPYSLPHPEKPTALREIFVQKRRLLLSEAISLWDWPHRLTCSQQQGPILCCLKYQTIKRVTAQGWRLYGGMVWDWRVELGSRRVICDRGLSGIKV